MTSVVDQFKRGSNVLLIAMFSDVIGGEVGEKKAKRSKGSTFQTVSALYRVSIGLLSDMKISIY